MPVSVSAPYDSYCELRTQDALGTLLAVVFCPRYLERCSQQGTPQPLQLTNSTVIRGIKLLKKDEHDELWVVLDQGKIALARCPVCKGRFRVLPCDVLPRKVYALPVLDLLAGEYNRGDRGLRPVAWSLLGEAPAHTTIRAWTEGLGAYALGRTNGEVSDALPASRVLAEVESRMPDLEAIRTQPVEVSPSRYRSEARRTRLIACARLILL